VFRVVPRQEQRRGSIASVEFAGEPYAAGISFLVGNLTAGQGPGLHRHPYPETCLVLSGQVAMVVDGEEVVAGAGDIIVVGPETPHRFTAIGDTRVDLVCVHASERFVIDWLDGRRGKTSPPIAEDREAVERVPCPSGEPGVPGTA
jgi:mannose-6-phosphate isomerase-like protein (cupin superfamily)